MAHKYIKIKIYPYMMLHYEEETRLSREQWAPAIWDRVDRKAFFAPANRRACAKALRQEQIYVQGVRRRSAWLKQSEQRREWSGMRSGVSKVCHHESCERENLWRTSGKG